MKGINNTKRIVGTAVFAALAFVTSLLEFPIFPLTPFLKMDFSAVFILLAGFIFGPLYGVSANLVKEAFCILKSSSGGIGELANFAIITAFILLPTIVYHFKKGIAWVIITLFFACLIQVAMSLLMNRFVNFPLYMGEKAGEMFASVWYFVALFNLIKSVSVSILTVLLYKRTSMFIKRI